MESRRFALLRHLTSAGNHWDLLLELDAAEERGEERVNGRAAERVATFKFVEDPTALRPGETLHGSVQSDHRRMYLDYSGAVSGGRGRVEQADAGTLTPLPDDACPPSTPLSKGALPAERVVRLRLAGRTMRGDYELRFDDNKGVKLTRLA